MKDTIVGVKDNSIHYQVIDDEEQQERDTEEFVKLCRPIVEYIQKHWHPHTRVIIDWDRASIFTENRGIPFEVPD